MLLAQRLTQDDERTALGEAYVDHELVFAREDGNPLAPEKVTKTFSELVQSLVSPSSPQSRSGSRDDRPTHSGDIDAGDLVRSERTQAFVAPHQWLELDATPPDRRRTAWTTCTKAHPTFT